MDVEVVRVLADNYVFLLRGPGGGPAAAVDPGEAAPVEAWLSRTGARLAAILVTHAHGDHTGGIRALLRTHPDVEVHAGSGDAARVPGATRRHDDGATFEAAGRAVRVIAVPGHTRGHVAYLATATDGGPGDLFVGDTLFPGTIGNLFEGTPDDMLASLRRLRELPAETRVWCAHEYGRQFLPAALGVDPDNARLRARIDRFRALPADAPTVPFPLEEERATNPFLRWDDPGLRARLGTTDDATTFRRLCEVL